MHTETIERDGHRVTMHVLDTPTDYLNLGEWQPEGAFLAIVFTRLSDGRKRFLRSKFSEDFWRLARSMALAILTEDALADARLAARI